MYIVVEGNIGAGKSSLIKALTYKFKDVLGCNVLMQLEKLDKWRNYNGINVLEYMYKGRDNWSFKFQVLALIDSIKNEIKASKFNGFAFTERSSLSVLEIFSPLLCSRADLSILKDLKSLNTGKPPDFIIYLRTDPKVCYKRVMARGRPEEVGYISEEYINNIHYLHEELFRNISKSQKILILDGTEDVDILVDTLFKILVDSYNEE